MASKKVRVHNLAKELLVTSKVIIEKCRAEGIEIKNHMHVVSAGLDATIREWFSEGAHTTTIEESHRVDLKKVRAKPKTSTRKKKTATADTSATEQVAEKTAEKKTATEKTATKKIAPKRKSPTEVAAEHTAEPATATSPVATLVAEAPPELEMPPAAEEAPVVIIEAPPTEAAPEPPEIAVPAEAATAAEAPPPTEVAPEPPPVVTAGPQNVPEPAKLSGPKVVRMDKPEQDDRYTPRPAARFGSRPPSPHAAPRAREEAGAEDDRPAKRSTPGRTAKPAEKRVHPRRTIRDTRVEATERLREWRDRDLIERRDRLAQASGRGIGRLRALEGKQTTRRTGQRTQHVHVHKGRVELPEPLIIKDFSRETGITVGVIQKRLMEEHGVFATINSTIDTEIAQLIAVEHGIELVVAEAMTGLDRLAEEYAAIERSHLETRPPVVTVLGHVDHGKTSLLDRIRKANVTAGEAGGITQHIGAYRVKVGDKWVAFVDTPGHTAFTAMRARGTRLTDVVVLVVAADDGVMPTTIEAINHAKAAKTPIVVALNKIDLPHDLNKIYGQLAEQGLTPSGDWGGDTDVIKTSAITGEGIEDLLSHLAMLSEVMEFKADPQIPAAGVVVEAERTGAMGNVARLMVQEGTLKPGDFIVCGAAYGRVRAIKDDTGKTIKRAGPSTPVEISGLSNVPVSGDKFYVVDSLQKAKDVAQEIAIRKREKELIRVVKPTSLESVLAGAAEGEIPELTVIIRADVQGSIDVLQKVLTEYPDDEVKLNILHAGVGSVTESDVVLAGASKAIIIAFHVAPEPAIQRLADEAGVDIRTYRIIYKVIDDIRSALEGLLAPDEKLESRGRAEVREVFSISRIGKIAGCYVREGNIERAHLVRIIRDGVVVKDRGEIESLRHFKNDVKEVKSGLECGIRIVGFDDLKPADIIETLELIKTARKLEV
ncbi:MAG: translation initiation factor IF-2 [Planctomycetota bacterium]